MSPQSPLITPDFEKHACALDRLPDSDNARYFFEMMSGGLLWEDEHCALPFSENGWFRVALAYRSSLILGKPRTEFEPIWSALKSAAPNWPGFRAERCTVSPELVAYLHEQKKKSMRTLERLDAVTSGRWKPLSGRQRDGVSSHAAD